MDVTAAEFVKRLKAFQTGPDQYTDDDAYMGVHKRDTFALAEEFVDMPPREIDKMLGNEFHDVRAGALRLMGRQFTHKKTPDSRHKELYELYIKRTDRINDWDLVDISGHYIVGGYLYDYDQPRDVLYKLARSKAWWERRLSMFATFYFIRKRDLDDTFKLGEILVHDEHDLVRKMVGWMLREAGKMDEKRLLSFLDTHAATAPRITLRYSIERLDPAKRKHYMGMKKEAA